MEIEVQDFQGVRVRFLDVDLDNRQALFEVLDGPETGMRYHCQWESGDPDWQVGDIDTMVSLGSEAGRS